MGIGDIVDKAKDALANVTGDEQKSDGILDKGQDLATDRFAGHDDKIQQGRDALDDRLGDNK